MCLFHVRYDSKSGTNVRHMEGEEISSDWEFTLVP